MSTLLVAARRYSALGLSIIPWRYNEGQKKPAVRWKKMQKTPWTDDEINAWWVQHPDHNVGVITGAVSNLIIIDCDDDDSVTWALENLPPTNYRVRTGRGVQFGFGHPGSPTKNMQKIGGLEMDLRGDGGYVALPPSIHKTGRPYEWETEGHPFRDLPTFDPAWLPVVAPTKPKLEVLAGGQVSRTNAYDRATRWMAKRDPAIEGQAGDHHTFVTAATLVRDFALPKSEAMELLLQWNQTCSPPWTEEQLLIKCNSALRSGSAAIGSKKTITPKAPVDLTDWASSVNPAAAPESPVFSNTDMGNARRLVLNANGLARFVYDASNWYVWDGKRFKPDDSGAAVRLAKDTVNQIPKEVIGLDSDSAVAAKRKFHHASQAAGRITAMLSLAASEPTIPAMTTDFNTDKWKLNAHNGVVNLRTGKLGPHEPAGMHSQLADTSYFKQACPIWMNFLTTVFDGNAELIHYIQQLAGYTLTGDVNEHLFLYCYGTGRNGKSTFLGTMMSLLGDYAAKAAPKLLIDKRAEPHPTELLSLRGQRMVLCGEVKTGDRLDEGKLKDLSGGESVRARGMRQDFFDFEPVHKLWLTGNNKLRIIANDPGMWDRLKLLPFTVYIKPEQRDPELLSKLKLEAPGILYWAVQGCRSYLQQGFKEPKCVTDAVNEYRTDEDMFGQFFDEICITDNKYARTSRAKLRSAYANWCSDNGVNPISARAVSSRLKEYGFKSTSSGERQWVGLGLRII